MSQTEPKFQDIHNLNAQAKAIIEKELGGESFWTGGIVKKAPYVSPIGYLYFSLDDGGYEISCMVRSKARGDIGFSIEKGMELEVRGSLYVYDKDGRIQIDVHAVQLVTRPEVSTAAATTIERLKKQGLYPPNKKAMPHPIRRIALVTSKRSDARADFENVYRENAVGHAASIHLEDILLEGQNAPKSIADVINRLNQEMSVEVIVLTRGGGRAVDLATFDDYLIAEAICRSAIPIVTGIGHHNDHTLADEVADKKTSTPTAAAFFLATGQTQESEAPVEIQPQPSNQRITIILIGAVAILAMLIAALLLLPTQ